MSYHAVGKRCAVNLEELNLPVSASEALCVLRSLGFKEVLIDVVSLARGLIPFAVHQRGVHYREAPSTVDCSGLIKWVYGQKGIWLPRLAIQQRTQGKEVTMQEVCAGDVFFISGRVDFYDSDPEDGVGHAGLATGEGTVVHSAGSKIGIIEVSLKEFFHRRKRRGVRRYANQSTRTFEIPEAIAVEWSDDFRWAILQNLPR